MPANVINESKVMTIHLNSIQNQSKFGGDRENSEIGRNINRVFQTFSGWGGDLFTLG